MRVRNFLCSITALLVIFTSCKEDKKDFSAAKTPGAKENLYEYKKGLKYLTLSTNNVLPSRFIFRCGLVDNNKFLLNSPSSS